MTIYSLVITPFPIWNQSIVPCPFLAVAFWPAYRFSGHSHLSKNFLQCVVIHTVKGFSIVHEAEVNVFLEFPCFLYDPTNVSNLIPGSFNSKNLGKNKRKQGLGKQSKTVKCRLCTKVKHAAGTFSQLMVCKVEFAFL